MNLEIGQTVWFFNENRRIYKRNESGRALGGPIWREHWEPLPVIGENSRSYLVGNYRIPYKLAKNKPIPSGWADSEDSINKEAFIQQSYLIAEKVRNCRDYDLLLKIAELVGYTPQP